MIECRICKMEFSNLHGLCSHIFHSHKITNKEYYDLFLKNKQEDKCRNCGDQTKFTGLRFGYHKYCSAKCVSLHNETKVKKLKKSIENFGVSNPFQSKQVKLKIELTNFKKYACKNPTQNSEIIQKIKKTNLVKYGVSSPLKNKNVKEKSKSTCLKKYGAEYTGQIPKNIERLKNGGSAYMQTFIKNPSKPQVELYNLVKSLHEDAILNFPVYKVNRVIDIAIPSLMIAIEYDSSYWNPNEEKDKIRQKELEDLGWKFIRYRDQVPTLENLKRRVSILHGKLGGFE